MEPARRIALDGKPGLLGAVGGEGVVRLLECCHLRVKDFDFDPQKMFEALVSAGAVIAISAIFFVVLMTFLFNLICDMTGGVRVTMIEQDLADARNRRGRKAKTEG